MSATPSKVYHCRRERAILEVKFEVPDIESGERGRRRVEEAAWGMLICAPQTAPAPFRDEAAAARLELLQNLRSAGRKGRSSASHHGCISTAGHLNVAHGQRSIACTAGGLTAWVMTTQSARARTPSRAGRAASSPARKQQNCTLKAGCVESDTHAEEVASARGASARACRHELLGTGARSRAWGGGNGACAALLSLVKDVSTQQQRDASRLAFAVANLRGERGAAYANRVVAPAARRTGRGGRAAKPGSSCRGEEWSERSTVSPSLCLALSLTVSRWTHLHAARPWCNSLFTRWLAFEPPL
eukprot:4936600-Pleurochrysis_carterae.AAC.1